ncbi:tyrosine-protein phosphatase [Lactobacillus helveticus]|uniref:Protein-tyrosine-phosphatase n=1 Tax=Lactobacillus helveticus TaxID=1587 RepID=A0A3Q8SU95_LACHE|nr:tyrosine-protein phosphatase [Lactobacillus helveticus]AFR22831.1 protein-tyrosine phosphatase [Lactobacillus helveticus R0052]AZK91523.1 Tyrosine-protein phosphatase precursor [Lactobacillus helveticus]MBW8008661.1 tyrosine-protein phosphatase [Lactobacillus helveticus]MBW8018790.1 tyrosine-protein phosphatase [Lactobacillus helveticus]MBW8043368.1 tyrosine-protein phosphatase [Lactobacillus helveticus]
MVDPIVLPLERVRNPRDLGGYIGDHGRRVKMYRLLRTGKISNITLHDQQFLLDYGLTKIIDLRSPLECHNMPDSKIPGVEHINLSISTDDNTQGGKKDLAKTFEIYRHDQYAGFKMMCDRYRSHVLKEHAQNSIHKILEVLANTEDGAVLYHCSEGKDRTGIVTVVVLYLLGVDMETIRQDYLYSNYMLNDYRAVRDKKMQEEGENLCFRANMRILGSVSDAFLDTALIAIEKDFGGIDNYLEEKIGVTPELRDKLRELYLEN